MPETDAKIFGEAYDMYTRYRWRILKEEDFLSLSNDIADFGERNGWQHNPLTDRLVMMLFDVFNDLYKDGRGPALPGYLGRSDL